MTTIIAIVAALLKAIPALEGIVSSALEVLAQGRAASAVARKAAKDAAVDAAVDVPAAAAETAQDKATDAADAQKTGDASA